MWTLLRKNVQNVRAIIKLIHFFRVKKGRHWVEELPLFQSYCVEPHRS